MRVIEHRWPNVSRGDVFHLYPIADVHIGPAACQEARFRATVQQIAEDPLGYWLDLGDKADFVNLSDKRFDMSTLADWITKKQLGDLAAAQRDRYLDIVKPIAPKCLGMVEGNHEFTIRNRYERDIHREIVCAIKDWGGMDADAQLDLGVTGWLMLKFSRSDNRHRTTTIRVNVHHGFVAGKLAGAKALNLQRWLWTHECDLALMGHSHNTEMQVEAVERVRGNRAVHDIRKGAFCGAYLNGADYAQRKGYFPVPGSAVMVQLRPGMDEQADRVRFTM